MPKKSWDDILVEAERKLFKKHGCSIRVAILFEIYDEAQRQKFLEKRMYG